MKVTVMVPPERALAIAQVFEEEGLEVSWTPPLERRDRFGEDAVQVVLYIAAGPIGAVTTAAVKRGIQRIQKHFQTLNPRVEDLPDDPTEGTS